MLVGHGAAVVAGFRLITVVLRPFVRGDGPVARREPLATGCAGRGRAVRHAVLPGLGDRVYHEAALWALALTIAVVRRHRPVDAAIPRTGRLVRVAGADRRSPCSPARAWASAPLVALGLVCLWSPVDRDPGPARAWPERRFDRQRWSCWALLLAGPVPW